MAGNIIVHLPFVLFHLQQPVENSAGSMYRTLVPGSSKVLITDSRTLAILALCFQRELWFSEGLQSAFLCELLLVVGRTAASDLDVCVSVRWSVCRCLLCGSCSLWLHLSASIVCRGPSAGLRLSPSSHLRLSPSLPRQQTASNLTPPPIPSLSASPGKPAVPLFLSPVPPSLMLCLKPLWLLVHFNKLLTSDLVAAQDVSWIYLYFLTNSFTYDLN